MQIVPLVVGDERDAMRLCQESIEHGVFAQAIRPPTVPEGTSRLRLATMASHTAADMRMAAAVLGDAARMLGLDPAAIGEPAREHAPLADEDSVADQEYAYATPEASLAAIEANSSAGVPFDIERAGDPAGAPQAPAAPRPRRPPAPAPAHAGADASSAPFDGEREARSPTRPRLLRSGARARTVRHRHRHGRRQDCRERRVAGGDGSRGRTGTRPQAGRDRPRRAVRGRRRGRLAGRPRAARARRPGWRQMTSRRCASARPSRRRWPRRSPERASRPRGWSEPPEPRATRRRDADSRGCRRPPEPARRGLHGLRPRRRTRAADARGRAPGPRHDQSHAADDPGGARCRTRRLRRRAHAVAAATIRARALEQGDDRENGRG